VISGTPTATGPAADVTVTVTDAFGCSASTTFAWTVRSSLSVSTPASQSSRVGSAVTPLRVTASGGVAPYSWTASGLPPGLAIDATGTVTGTPTSSGTFQVTVTVTDAAHASATTGAFTWSVASNIRILAPLGDRSDQVDDVVLLLGLATGGDWPYTWSATNLPPGVTMYPVGLLVGRVDTGTRYVVTVTATDRTGDSASVTFVWNVTPKNPGDLEVTQPTTDRAGDHVGQTVTITAQASGGGHSQTWTASGLPPGTTISGDGVITGRLTTAGSYLVTLTVEGNNHKTAIFMFTWVVQ